mgnify:CR=1 FL=1
MPLKAIASTWWASPRLQHGHRAAMFAGPTHTARRTDCRGDAVRRPGAIVHDGTASSQVPARYGPGGRPTGSPLHCPPVGCRIV